MPVFHIWESMAFTACFVFQQELRTEIHLLSSYFIVWLFGLLSFNRWNTDTITREHSSSRSEKPDLWVGKCHWNWSSALVPDHLAFKHCSTMAWEGCLLCATASLGGPKLPVLLPLRGVSQLAAGWQMDHRELTSGRAVLAQQLRGNCLAAGQGCMHKGGKTVCLLVLDREGWAVFLKTD